MKPAPPLSAVLCLGPADGWQVEPPLGCVRIRVEIENRSATYHRGPGRHWLHAPAYSDDMRGLEGRRFKIHMGGLDA